MLLKDQPIYSINKYYEKKQLAIKQAVREECRKRTEKFLNEIFHIEYLDHDTVLKVYADMFTEAGKYYEHAYHDIYHCSNENRLRLFHINKTFLNSFIEIINHLFMEKYDDVNNYKVIVWACNFRNGIEDRKYISAEYSILENKIANDKNLINEELKNNVSLTTTDYYYKGKHDSHTVFIPFEYLNLKDIESFKDSIKSIVNGYAKLIELNYNQDKERYS